MHLFESFLRLSVATYLLWFIAFHTWEGLFWLIDQFSETLFFFLLPSAHEDRYSGLSVCLSVCLYVSAITFEPLKPGS